MSEKISYICAVNKHFQVSHNLLLFIFLLLCGMVFQDLVHFADEIILYET